VSISTIKPVYDKSTRQSLKSLFEIRFRSISEKDLEVFLKILVHFLMKFFERKKETSCNLTISA